jgi:Aerotolerance regulator N-terminal
VSFLYPLFLIAGCSLAIPVVIHLFNLRKYQVMPFSDVRFLRNIQLRSKKQSQVQHKLLLALRLLFLAALVIAFAQPFFGGRQPKEDSNKMQVIYLDNSYSMLAQKGNRTLLDLARDNALQILKSAKPGTRFLILTNDKPASYRPEPLPQAMQRLRETQFSSARKTATQVLTTVQHLLADQATDPASGTNGATVYYFSDFQKTSFPEIPEKSLTDHITFYAMPLQGTDVSDIGIDTAFFTVPVLEAGHANRLVVKTHKTGSGATEQPVLQLKVNGQVKSALSVNFKDRNESTDTLSCSFGDLLAKNGRSDWQQIELTLNDGSLKFDDTFRIAAKMPSNLTVLVLNENQPNPYIMAAFKAYSGFRLQQAPISAAPQDWSAYNLVVLNGVTKIDEQLGKAVNAALERGQSICIFPARTPNIQLLNRGLREFADIQITGTDTAVQTATSVQQGSDLVKDIFEKMPENVQLPVANWHYVLSAGLSANRQSIISFAGGDPLFAKFTPTKGQLYFCSTAADMNASNFPSGYFFAPFLYEMAMQSGSGSMYAVTAGAPAPVYLSLRGSAERNTIHVYKSGLDMVPPQQSSGIGVDVFLGGCLSQPGFYDLAAQGSDTVVVALNQDKSEAQLDYCNIPQLRKDWANANVVFSQINEPLGDATKSTNAQMPLWKICALTAVLLLLAETAVLALRNPGSVKPKPTPSL